MMLMAANSDIYDSLDCCAQTQAFFVRIDGRTLTYHTFRCAHH